MKKKNEIQKKIESFCRAHSVCGNDGGMFEYISSLLYDFCDSISADSMGNIIAKRNSSQKDAKTIALVAVCDEPGFAVTSSEEDRKILHPVGLKEKALSRLSGKTATTISGKKGILVPSGDTLCLESDEDIKEGDFVYPEESPVFAGDKVYLFSAAAKLFLVCISDIAARDGDFPVNLEFIFLASHLLGARGAKAAAYKTCAEHIIAFDFVTGSTVKSGEGPVIATCDSGGFCNAEMTDALKVCADELGIKVQMCAEIQKERPSIILPFITEGKKTSLVGVCCDMLSEGVAKCDIKDILGCEALVCAYLIFEENGEK